METTKTDAKKKSISRQTVNKIKFFSYVLIFMATGITLIIEPQLGSGSLKSNLENIMEILIVILFCVAAVLLILDAVMDNSSKVEKKDELYNHNEQLSNSLALNITMTVLLVGAVCLNSSIPINNVVAFFAYSIIGLIKSSSMLILEHSSKNTDIEEDEEQQ